MSKNSPHHASNLGLLATSVQANRELLKKIFNNSADIVFRYFTLSISSYPQALLIFIEGLVNTETINKSILDPLMFKINNKTATNLIDVIKSSLPNNKIKPTNLFDELITGILSGDSALIIDGFSTGILIDTKGWEARGVQEPQTESVVRGPREGFTESIGVNTALLRRKIKNKNLCFEALSLGTQTDTTIYMAYLIGIANEKIVQEVKNRLQRINIDSILESGYIEQYIEDEPASIFPTIGNTEKPDILAGKLLEGRIGIFVDGTPFVLTVPYLLVEAFQNSEDYYSRPFYASVIRGLRYLAFLISILLPSVYVALGNFHQEMIPTSLLISMAASREGIPFPPYVEVVVMGMIFEILREAGVRLPRPVGQAVSIVGALVLGQAAVDAGIVSDIMVIIVALTAIAGFVVAPLADAVSLLRLFFIVCSGTLGLFGTLMGIIFVYIYLAKLRSFGIPYLFPVSPGNLEGLKDVFIRFPLPFLNKRPILITKNQTKFFKNRRLRK